MLHGGRLNSDRATQVLDALGHQEGEDREPEGGDDSAADVLVLLRLMQHEGRRVEDGPLEREPAGREKVRRGILGEGASRPNWEGGEAKLEKVRRGILGEGASRPNWEGGEAKLGRRRGIL